MFYNIFKAREREKESERDDLFDFRQPFFEKI